MARTPSLVPMLSAGRHRNPRKGACFMEFASFLAGERWSDHPACTHPLLAALARDVNDFTTDAARDRLLPLVHRVIGLNSDDPRLGAVIAMRAATAALPIASAGRQQALGVGILGLLAGWADDTMERLAAEAFASAPHAERWAREFAAAVGSMRSNPRATASIVHSAVLGIALACVNDTDDRLRELLESAIIDAEAFTRSAGTPSRQLQPA